MLVGMLVACGGETLAPLTDPAYVPPPDHCEDASLGDLHTFAPCNRGSGIFGEWQTDESGLPSYFYGLDHRRDARASYPVTELDADSDAIDPREHWAAFGNRRINAMFFNDGHVEVVTQDRGVEHLNKLDLEQGNVAGGFGYVDDGDATWCTAYRWRPLGAATTRRFGMGWAETSIVHRAIRLTRTMAAPPGDASALVSDVVIENLADTERTLSHYEVWDVGRRPVEINWVVSGSLLAGAPASARAQRDERNAMFSEHARFDPERRAVAIERIHQLSEPPPSLTEPDAVDYYPGWPFLAALDAPVDDVFVDQRAFFGAGGPADPTAVRDRHPGLGSSGFLTGTATSAPRSALGQPHVLVLKSTLSLRPGQSRRLRYAYGYSRWGEPPGPDIDALSSIDDVRGAYADHMRERMFLFATERDPALHRELAWHSYQLETSVGRRDYWQGHVVPQGSAYLYLHGADGAARDLGLFAVPLVYTDPPLAKEELRLYMGIQLVDGSFSYALQGHGMIDDAGIHTAPSDLALFFLWAVGEYIGATGDLALLGEAAPFYPREARPSATGWDHLTAAVRHQFDTVSTGEHGLIRVQTGDWSDGIVVAAPDRQLAIDKGESIPNTQMAVAVLPRIADLIETRDPALSEEIRDRALGYRQALADQSNGTFFYRAYYGDGIPVGADAIDLEAQVWALIGDTAGDDAARRRLIDAIAAELDDPSAIGATLQAGGQVWPAISALLTWGYARHDAERAWRHMSRNTMTSHALAFPEIWYGIWSGPDGLRSDTGWAWASQVTPMLDFPVQNNNQHAMPILAALRLAGVDATSAGILVAPPTVDEAYALSCRLLDLSLSGDVVSVRYRPSGASARRLLVRPPPGTSVAHARYGSTEIRAETSGEISVDAIADLELFVELASQ